MGNQSLAGDISVTIGDLMSESIIIAFQSCEDMDDALSLNQKRHIVSACMTVVMESKDRVRQILDFDNLCDIDLDIEQDGVSHLFEEVTNEFEGHAE